jgi:hypothetical protein
MPTVMIDYPRNHRTHRQSGIPQLQDENKTVADHAANIIARLHARAKTSESEQEKRELRSIREQDAELATQCLGTLLCEIGLAKWA